MKSSAASRGVKRRSVEKKSLLFNRFDYENPPGGGFRKAVYQIPPEKASRPLSVGLPVLAVLDGTDALQPPEALGKIAEGGKSQNLGDRKSVV